jgi:prolyl-tRNA editing enzyme YbaK/EbsC (Cys-tRNA(Pro) deacylase)
MNDELAAGVRRMLAAADQRGLAVELRQRPAAEALEATSYERGTITPIGSEPSWPVIIDRQLLGRRAALGAGGHGYSAFVDIDDLVRAFDATVADIAN